MKDSPTPSRYLDSFQLVRYEDRPATPRRTSLLTRGFVIAGGEGETGTTMSGLIEGIATLRIPQRPAPLAVLVDRMSQPGEKSCSAERSQGHR